MELPPFQWVIDTALVGDHCETITCGEVTVRYLSQCAAEARQNATASQDELVVASDARARSLVWCMCDGVGSSYQGGFAAQYLGRRLTRWLCELDLRAADPYTLAARLRNEMQAWAVAAQRELLAQPISTHTAPLVAEVLAETRATYGSETVFLAGRLDVHTPDAAKGVVCWMGNVRGHLLFAEHDPLALGGDDDRERWSSGRGVRGMPRVATVTIPRPQRLLVMTDGADLLATDLLSLADVDLAALARRTLDLPTSDDITILDIRWPVNAGE